MFLFQLNSTDEDDTVADQGEGEDPRKYNKISELCITDVEMAVVDKIYSSMGQCNKKIVMPAVYQAMIDCWRGVKTYRQMLGILAQGKASLAYRHILIMTNLPYFREMSSRFVSRPHPVIIFNLQGSEVSDEGEWLCVFRVDDCLFLLWSHCHHYSRPGEISSWRSFVQTNQISRRKPVE